MTTIAGLDEVGWGALAGPIISVVAVFRDKDLNLIPPGVRDSKKLSRNKINELYVPLTFSAYDIGIGYAWPEEIDTIKPGPALQLSYKRALDDLTHKPDLLIMDGQNKVQAWKGKQICEPKADDKYKQVGAASIIAKHYRDRIMMEYSHLYPSYGWDHNAGYSSDDHVYAIKTYGLLITPGKYYHRRLYCRKFLIK
jgi:ribonuclease HII